MSKEIEGAFNDVSLSPEQVEELIKKHPWLRDDYEPPKAPAGSPHNPINDETSEELMEYIEEQNKMLGDPKPI